MSVYLCGVIQVVMPREQKFAQQQRTNDEARAQQSKPCGFSN
jgi:hypothetical protein